MKLVNKKEFSNGVVYALKMDDGALVEVTDTFLPFYTKDSIGSKQNTLKDGNLGDRSERWMIGVSVMSGCPVRCKFCATGQMKKSRNLTNDEIISQVMFIIEKNPTFDPKKSKEFKINYTRMGDYGLNQQNIKDAIVLIDDIIPNTHHYISTIGVKGMDTSFIKDNISLQLSLHSFDESHRDWLIPYKKKMSIKELGQVRTESNLKTTINLTLIEDDDFNIDELKKYFDPEFFFIKLSPINKNTISESNDCGGGIITSKNLI
jgi:23S rRNA (adenine2503-C2)-methyltransferase